MLRLDFFKQMLHFPPFLSSCFLLLDLLAHAYFRTPCSSFLWCYYTVALFNEPVHYLIFIMLLILAQEVSISASLFGPLILLAIISLPALYFKSIINRHSLLLYYGLFGIITAGRYFIAPPYCGAPCSFAAFCVNLLLLPLFLKYLVQGTLDGRSFN